METTSAPIETPKIIVPFPLKMPDMALPADFVLEHLVRAESSFIMGACVADLSRNELLAVTVFLGEQLSARIKEGRKR